MAAKKIHADRFRAFAEVIDAVQALPNADKRVVLTAVLELVPTEPRRLERAPLAARVARKARKPGPKLGHVPKCSICGKPGHNARGHHKHAAAP